MNDTRIVKSWCSTNRRFGFVMLSSQVNFNNMWMGTTKQEVVEGILEINNRREKLGLDSLRWCWSI